MSVKAVIRDIESRITWLDNKIDPDRDPSSAMHRERRSLWRALELIKRYQDMRDFIEERRLKQDFYEWLGDQNEA